MVKIDYDLYAEIGRILKQSREKKKLSLDQVCELLNAEKTKSSLKRYEDGVSRIDMGILEKLCSIYGIELNKVIESAQFATFKLHSDDETKKFSNVQDAIEYILRQPLLAQYGGYDISKMSDDEIIEFANDTLNMISVLSKKYIK